MTRNKFCFKAISLFVAVSFLSLQIAWANPDVIALNEKNDRSNFLSADEFLKQMKNKDTIASKLNLIEANQAQNNIWVTTEDGTKVNYRDGNISSVVKDGALVSDIIFDPNNTIKDATLKTADGRRLVYSDYLIEKEILADNSEVRYSYEKDQEGNIVKTILTTDQDMAVYDKDGWLSELNRSGRVYTYRDGKLDKVLSGSWTYSYQEDSKDGFTLNYLANAISADGSSVFFDKDGAVISGEVPLTLRDDISNLSFTYDSNNNLIKSTSINGAVINYKDGLLDSAVNPDGGISNFRYSLDNSIQIIKDGLSRNYDSNGGLAGLVMDGGTLLYLKDNQVSSIQTKEGVLITDFKFGSDAILTDGHVTNTDGSVLIYKEGRLASTITADGKKYAWTYTDINKTAVLQDTASHNEETDLAVQMQYDLSGALMWIRKNNGTIITYSAGLIDTVKDIAGSIQRYNYEKDGAGQILWTIIEDGPSKKIYDANGELDHIELSAQDGLPVTLNYKYGKLRSLNKGGSPVVLYSYEYDVSGHEITVTTEPGTGFIRRYKDSLLISVTDKDKYITEYDYSDKTRIVDNQAVALIKQATLKRYDRVIHTYLYAYENGNTIVTDEENNIKVFDKDNNIISITSKEGLHYEYTAIEKPDFTDINIKSSYKKNNDGSTVYFSKGVVDKVILNDGTMLTDIKLGQNSSNITGANVFNNDGAIVILENSKVKKIINKDKSEIVYDDNGLVATFVKDGKTYNYLYTFKEDGKAVRVIISDSQAQVADYDLANENIRGAKEGLNLNSLLANSSFESGLSNWTANSCASASIDSGYKGKDSSVVRVVSSAASDDNAQFYQDYSDFNKLKGKTVTLAVWVKTDKKNSARIRLSDDVNPQFSRFHSGSGDWELLTATMNISNDARWLRNDLRIEGSGTTYFYAPRLVEGVYIPDTAKPEMEKPSLLSNTSFESGLSVWRANSNISVSATTGMNNSGTAASVYYNGEDNGQLYQDYSGYRSLIGKTVRLSAWVKAARPNQAIIRLSDDADPRYSQWHSGSGVWEYLSVTKVVHNDAIFLRNDLRVQNYAGMVYYDNIKLEVLDSASGSAVISPQDQSADLRLTIAVNAFKNNKAILDDISGKITGVNLDPINTILLDDIKTTAVLSAQNQPKLLRLVSKINSDGSITYYSEGKIDRIVLDDGVILTNIKLDENSQKVVSADILNKDGSVIVFENSKVKKVIKVDKSEFTYDENGLVANVTKDGKSYKYVYVVNANGAPSRIIVYDQQGQIADYAISSEDINVFQLGARPNNLLNNALFSNSAFGWSINSGAGISMESGYKTNGASVIKMISTNTHAQFYQDYADFAKLKGKIVTFAVWVKTDKKNTFRIRLSDDVNPQFSRFHSGSGDWELLTVTTRVGENANWTLRSDIRGEDTGVALLFNPVLVEGIYIPEIAKPQMEKPSLLYNTSFEGGTSGWRANGNTSASTTTGMNGSGSAASVYWNGEDNAQLYQDIPNYKDFAGKTVTLSAWVKAYKPNQAVLRLTDWVDTNFSQFHSGSGQWEKLSITLKVTNDPLTLKTDLRVHNYSGTVYFDDIRLEVVDMISTSTSIAQTQTVDPRITLVLNAIQNDKPVTDIISNKILGISLEPQTTISYEYDKNGNLVAAENQDGLITTYENGRIAALMNDSGQTIVEYQYDEEGNPISIELVQMRRNLESALIAAKEEISKKKLALVEEVAKAYSTNYYAIKEQATEIQQAYSSVISELNSNQGQIESTKVSGSSAKKAKNELSNKIGSEIDKARRLSSEANDQIARAYAELNKEIRYAKDRIERDENASLDSILNEVRQVEGVILLQEVTPLVSHYYRLYLGRDPDENEISAYLTKAKDINPYDLNARKNLAGYIKSQVKAIKDSKEYYLVERGIDQIIKDYDTSQWVAEIIKEQYGQIIKGDSLNEFLNILKGKLSITTNDAVSQYIHNTQNNAYHNEKEALLNLEAEIAKRQKDILISEITGYLDKIGLAGKVDPDVIKSQIMNLDEYITRRHRINAIKGNIAKFLDEYLTKDINGKLAMAASLGLGREDVYNLTSEDIEIIKEYIKKQDMHFGDSAFEPLMAILNQNNVNVSYEDLATEMTLVDILTDVINPNTTDGLKLSIFAIQKAASIYGLNVSAVRLSFDELVSANRSAPSENIIIHVEDNHYVVLTDIADGKITYLDTATGPNGKNITVTKDEFLKIWKGYALFNKDKIKEISGKVLIKEEAQKIKGSFFPIIALIVKFIIDYALVISVTSSLLSLGLSFVDNPIAQTFSKVFGIIGLATGVLNIGVNIWTALTTKVGTTAAAAGGMAANAAGQAAKTGFVETLKGVLYNVGKAISASVISMSASNTLTKLGANSTISNIVGSALGGWSASIASAGATVGNVVGSTLSGVVVGGVTELGKHYRLDPAVTSVIGIAAGSIVNAGIGGINVTETRNILDATTKQLKTVPVLVHKTGLDAIGVALKTQILPNMASELAFYGVTKGLEATGVDSRIAQLAGIPIRSTLSAVTQGIFNNGKYLDVNGNVIRNTKTGNSAKLNEVILGPITKGILSGITSVAIDFAGQSAGMEAWQTALISNAAVGVIGAFDPVKDTAGNYVYDENKNVVRKGLPASFTERFSDSIINTFTLGLGNKGYNSLSAWDKTLSLGKVGDFGQIVKEQGLASALETYATSVFQRDTVEYLVSKYGSIANAIIAKLNNSPYDKQQKADLSSAYEDIRISYQDGILDVIEGSISKHLALQFTSNGRLLLPKGDVTIRDSNGTMRTYYINDYKQDWMMLSYGGSSFSVNQSHDMLVSSYTIIDNDKGVAYDIKDNKVAGSVILPLSLGIGSFLNENIIVDFKTLLQVGAAITQNLAGNLITAYNAWQGLGKGFSGGALTTYVTDDYKDTENNKIYFPFAAMADNVGNKADDFMLWIKNNNMLHGEIFDKALPAVLKGYSVITGAHLDDLYSILYISSLGDPSDLVVDSLLGFMTGKMRVGSEIPLIFKDFTKSYQAFKENDIEAAGRYLGSTTARIYRESSRILDLIGIEKLTKNLLEAGTKSIYLGMAKDAGKSLLKNYFLQSQENEMQIRETFYNLYSLEYPDKNSIFADFRYNFDSASFATALDMVINDYQSLGHENDSNYDGITKIYLDILTK